MTSEEKQLLLIDLCGRLPYRVIVKDRNATHELSTGNTEFVDLFNGRCYIKPYLRPMSSMTEGEFLEYHNIKYNKVTYRRNYKRIEVGKFHNVGIIPIEDYLDWLNAHHFDYRGLIEIGLALEAPEDMYETTKV